MTRADSGPDSVEALLALYDLRGHHHYGENVTQGEHALQCASLAIDAGASDVLVCAALLHDVGHLLDEPPASDREHALGDDGHEASGAHVLARLFGPTVAGPVALHVVAKRWRCAVEPSYLASLSDASLASLAAQGGPLDAAACTRFETSAAFEDAVSLREWDDAAKVLGRHCGELREHTSRLVAAATRHAAVSG